MGKAYYLCCRVVWKGARAQSRLPLFKGLTSSSASHSLVVLLVFRFWFHEDFDSVVMPAFQMPVCMNKSTVRSWQMKGSISLIVSGLKAGQVQSHLCEECSFLGKSHCTWRWSSNLLPGPWGPLFFSAELGECAMTHHHNRHTTDCAVISFSPLILQWKVACRGPPANTRGATSHPVFCEGSIRAPTSVKAHYFSTLIPQSPFLCSSDNILVNS